MRKLIPSMLLVSSPAGRWGHFPILEIAFEKALPSGAQNMEASNFLRCCSETMCTILEMLRLCASRLRPEALPGNTTYNILLTSRHARSHCKRIRTAKVAAGDRHASALCDTQHGQAGAGVRRRFVPVDPKLHLLDLLVLLASVVVFLVIGASFSGKQKSTHRYFKAGGAIPA